MRGDGRDERKEGWWWSRCDEKRRMRRIAECEWLMNEDGWMEKERWWEMNAVWKLMLERWLMFLPGLGVPDRHCMCSKYNILYLIKGSAKKCGVHTFHESRDTQQQKMIIILFKVLVHMKHNNDSKHVSNH